MFSHVAGVLKESILTPQRRPTRHTLSSFLDSEFDCFPGLSATSLSSVLLLMGWPWACR